MSACVITNMLHFRHSKSAQNLLLPDQLLYIVKGIRCDCGSMFCRCYDVSSLYCVVVMTFMHLMAVIVVFDFIKVLS